MKTYLLTGWTAMRLLRLITGITGISFAIVNQDWLLGLAGIMLLLMAVFNLGCCGASGCSVRR